MEVQDDAYLLEALEEMEIIEQKKRRAESTKLDISKKIKSVNIDRYLNDCSIVTFGKSKTILPDNNDVLCYNLNQTNKGLLLYGIVLSTGERLYIEIVQERDYFLATLNNDVTFEQVEDCIFEIIKNPNIEFSELTSYDWKSKKNIRGIKCDIPIGFTVNKLKNKLSTITPFFNSFADQIMLSKIKRFPFLIELKEKPENKIIKIKETELVVKKPTFDVVQILKNELIYATIIPNYKNNKLNSLAVSLKKGNEIQCASITQEEDNTGSLYVTFESDEKSFYKKCFDLLSNLEFDILIGIDSIECMKKLRTNIVMNGKLRLSGSFGYYETSITDGKIDCDFNDIKKLILDSKPSYVYSIAQDLLKNIPQYREYLSLSTAARSLYDATVIILIFKEKDILETTILLSETCRCPLKFCMKGNTSLKVDTLFKHKLYSARKILPPTDYEKKDQKVSVQGGHVFKPIPKLHNEYITAMIDFSASYPNIIIEKNICPTQAGILPKISSKLLNKRKQVQLLMKETQGEELKTLNLRQLALKITGNTFYGCLAQLTSIFYCPDLANLITETARNLEKSTMNIVNENDLEGIGGDTDSIQINTKTKDKQEAEIKVKKITDIVNNSHQYINIKLEGLYESMFLGKKKTWAAKELNKERYEIRGLSCNKVTTAPIVRRFVTEGIHMILSSKKTTEQIVIELMKLYESFNGKLCQSSSEYSDYILHERIKKENNTLLGKAAAHCIKEGISYVYGQSFPYIFTNQGVPCHIELVYRDLISVCYEKYKIQLTKGLEGFLNVLKPESKYNKSTQSNTFLSIHQTFGESDNSVSIPCECGHINNSYNGLIRCNKCKNKYNKKSIELMKKDKMGENEYLALEVLKYYSDK